MKQQRGHAEEEGQSPLDMLVKFFTCTPEPDHLPVLGLGCEASPLNGCDLEMGCLKVEEERSLDGRMKPPPNSHQRPGFRAGYTSVGHDAYEQEGRNDEANGRWMDDKYEREGRNDEASGRWMDDKYEREGRNDEASGRWMEAGGGGGEGGGGGGGGHSSGQAGTRPRPPVHATTSNLASHSPQHPKGVLKNAGDVNLSLNLSSIGQGMNDYDQDETEVMTHWKDVTAKRGEGLGGSKEKEGAGVSPEQYAGMKKKVDTLWAQLSNAIEERDYHQRRYDEVKFDRLSMIEDERLAYRRKVTHCVDKVSDLEHEYHTALVRLKKAEPGAKQRAEVQKYYEEVMEKEILKNAKAMPVFRKKNKSGHSPRPALGSPRNESSDMVQQSPRGQQPPPPGSIVSPMRRSATRPPPIQDPAMLRSRSPSSRPTGQSPTMSRSNSLGQQSPQGAPRLNRSTSRSRSPAPIKSPRGSRDTAPPKSPRQSQSRRGSVSSPSAKSVGWGPPPPTGYQAVALQKQKEMQDQ